MYQAPVGVRTDAWKPSGLRSAAIVAFGSSMPIPLKVEISGCFTARPGAMTSDFESEKRWNAPVGSGRETITPCGFVPALDVAAVAAGALSSSDARPLRSSEKASSFSGRTSGLAPWCAEGSRLELLLQRPCPGDVPRPGPAAETTTAASVAPTAIAAISAARRSRTALRPCGS